MTSLQTPGGGVTGEELDRLQGLVVAARERFLEELEALCSIDCGSYSPAGVNAVGNWVAARFEALGGAVDRRPDPAGRLGDTVIGRFSGRAGAGPRLLLIGHMDTVFPDGTAAERPFRIRDGIATGPGVTDMKGG